MSEFFCGPLKIVAYILKIIKEPNMIKKMLDIIMSDVTEIIIY